MQDDYPACQPDNRYGGVLKLRRICYPVGIFIRACVCGNCHFLKGTDQITLTGTSCPSCMPGVHSGILLIILIASWLRECSTPLRMEIWLTEPSVLTTNEHVTLPCIPFLYASAGYCLFSFINATSLASPPGKLGFFFT